MICRRLAYLTATNALALLRLLPMSDRDKDIEFPGEPRYAGVVDLGTHDRFPPTRHCKHRAHAGWFPQPQARVWVRSRRAGGYGGPLPSSGMGSSRA